MNPSDGLPGARTGHERERYPGLFRHESASIRRAYHRADRSPLTNDRSPQPAVPLGDRRKSCANWSCVEANVLSARPHSKKRGSL